MPTPRVAAIQDLSAFGRCSLTVIMPALSAMGIQCCPVLTAYLSTHTGGFGNNTFLDLTDEMEPVLRHWKELDLHFDALFSGFMGSTRQIEITAEFLRSFRNENCIAIVDPVMGDNGKLYRTYTPEMCAKLSELTAQADVITPNRTEAAVLLGVPYEALRLENEKQCADWARRLSRDGTCSVVLKGVSYGEDRVGAVCFDRTDGSISFVSAPRVKGEFHGTGDLFASVLTGGLIKGRSLQESVQWAADFVSDCAGYTLLQGTPRREGIDFEPLLWQLGNR